MFWNEEVEMLDRAGLQELQLERLKATLERSYTVVWQARKAGRLTGNPGTFPKVF